MHQHLMHVAMTNLSMVRGTGPARSLLLELADVSGIPLTALLKAERRMTSGGSLQPLRALLADPMVPKADRLKYKIGLKSLVKPGRPGKSDQQVRIIFDVGSERGRLQIVIDMSLKERAAGETQSRQTARMAVSFRLVKGAMRRTVRQAMTVSAFKPRVKTGPRPVTLRAA